MKVNMLGAIIGDVVGSRFEFNNIKTKEFDLFNEESRFTDDTVLTIAVMDWCVHAKNPKAEAAKYLQKWARKYPYAGYGGKFVRWKDEENPKPYYSCGNGSAMRISPVGFIFEDFGDMKEACGYITNVTHNHPEGLKGAEVTATLIFMAKNGATREELRDYAERAYPEIKNLNYDELVVTYKHEKEICQCTVPQAIYCFLISNDFEDCLRTTISIGGDCDTTAAISCAIAEAFYGEIPDYIVEETLKRLPKKMVQIIEDANFISDMQ